MHLSNVYSLSTPAAITRTFERRESHWRCLLSHRRYTALAEFYLSHRLSEDLDFFSEQEFAPGDISSILKKIQAKTTVTTIRFEQAFNRNLFFLEYPDDTVKTEFTYFPFPRIEQKQKLGNIFIDSLLDIAVNKTFTIYQKPRSRDFIDLYCILQKEQSWGIEDLVKKAQVKFDNYLDPLQLGSQLMRVTELKDYPRMLISLEQKVWQNFWLSEAKKLLPKVVE